MTAGIHHDIDDRIRVAQAGLLIQFEPAENDDRRIDRDAHRADDANQRLNAQWVLEYRQCQQAQTKRAAGHAKGNAGQTP